MAFRIVHPSEVRYIKHELETGNPTRQKVILQHVGKRLSSGFRFNAADATSIQITISGVALVTADRKALRWSLNVLALFGDSKFAAPAATHAISKMPDDPEILSSALSALAAADFAQFERISNSANYPRELVVLSALRNVQADKVDMSNLAINIETADEGTLKLALLTVGLDRAPAHIFHPRHNNSEIVKVLGGHHDPIVSQYSVWAIAENDSLGISDLGISVAHVEDCPANVRGWVYRLYGSADAAPADRHDVIVRGSEDVEAEARSSLAKGLRDNYYDGLEQVTTAWFVDERDEEVRRQVLDHLVRHAHVCASYEELVYDVYTSEVSNIELRERMEASAAGTRIFTELKHLAATEQAGFLEINLFGDMNVANSPINIGSVQGGAVAIGSGNATNYGGNSNSLAPEKIAIAIQELDSARAAIDALPLDADSKSAATKTIDEAKKNPTAEKIGAVAAVLKTVQESLGAISGAGDHIAKIGGYVTSLIALLPQ